MTCCPYGFPITTTFSAANHIFRESRAPLQNIWNPHYNHIFRGKPHIPRKESSPSRHMDSPLQPHFPRPTTYSAKRPSLGKKASQTPPKVSKSHPNFFGGDVTYGHLTFCKKTGQIWYIVASGAPFLIYRRI